MSAFWSLVKNDTGLFIKQYTSRSRWVWVYILAFILAGLAYNAAFLIKAREVQDPRFISLVFVPFYMVMSGRIISDEWRNDTVGWWLALPYSRLTLLGAKITASFINYIRWAIVAVIASSGLFLEVFFTRPDLFAGALPELSTRIIQLFALLIVFSPFAVMSGIFLRVVFHSGLRPCAPLFWIALPTAFFYIISLFVKGSWDSAYMDKVCMIFNDGRGFFLLLLLEILMCAVIGLISIQILDKQVKV